MAEFGRFLCFGRHDGDNPVNGILFKDGTPLPPKIRGRCRLPLIHRCRMRRAKARIASGFSSALCQLYPKCGRGYFRLRQGASGGAYPLRYVRTERRRMGQKEPQPEGLRRRGAIRCVAPRSRRTKAVLPRGASPLDPRRLNRTSDISETVHWVI